MAERRLYVPAGLETDSIGRVVDPHVELDTPEGKYSLPVAVLATFQHQIIIEDIVNRVTANILEEVLPRLNSLLGLDDSEESAEQLSLPL